MPIHLDSLDFVGYVHVKICLHLQDLAEVCGHVRKLLLHAFQAGVQCLVLFLQGVLNLRSTSRGLRELHHRKHHDETASS
jgi:hypothetical protein